MQRDLICGSRDLSENTHFTLGCEVDCKDCNIEGVVDGANVARKAIAGVVCPTDWKQQQQQQEHRADTEARSVSRLLHNGHCPTIFFEISHSLDLDPYIRG